MDIQVLSVFGLDLLKSSFVLLLARLLLLPLISHSSRHFLEIALILLVLRKSSLHSVPCSPHQSHAASMMSLSGPLLLFLPPLTDSSQMSGVSEILLESRAQ